MTKKIKYNGPELKPGKPSQQTQLEALHYAKNVMANSQHYEMAAQIREYERNLQDKYNLEFDHSKK